MDFLGPPINIREAVVDDSSLIWAWRNDPETVRNSLSQSPVSSEEHEHWFAQQLESEEGLLLVAERPTDQGPLAIGVCRFDLAKRMEALVNINLAPSERGKGLGKVVLGSGISYLRRVWPEVRFLRAEVMEVNFPSRSIFENLGFEAQGTLDGVIEYKLILGLEKD